MGSNILGLACENDFNENRVDGAVFSNVEFVEKRYCDIFIVGLFFFLVGGVWRRDVFAGFAIH